MSAPISKSDLKQVPTHDPVWQQLRDEAQQWWPKNRPCLPSFTKRS